MNKKYSILTEEFLRDQYLTQNKSALQISSEVGCCERQIRTRLSKFDIKRPKISHEEKFKDFIGKQYNRWIIIAFDHVTKNNQRTMVKCKCECGKELIRDLNSIKGGFSKSCGCLVVENNKTGYGEISGQFWRRMEGSAIKRGKEFTITIEYAWNLFLKQNRKCALTGTELIFVSDGNQVRYQTASLDRIDNNKDYIEGNVQWIHKRVNWIKSTLSVEELLFWCKKMLDYNKNYKVSIDFSKKIHYMEST